MIVSTSKRTHPRWRTLLKPLYHIAFRFNLRVRCALLDGIGRFRRDDPPLPQAELAKLIRTTASGICRLEDAEYEGHSLAMLRRIADALHQRVEIRFVPVRRSAQGREA